MTGTRVAADVVRANIVDESMVKRRELWDARGRNTRGGRLSVLRDDGNGGNYTRRSRKSSLSPVDDESDSDRNGVWETF